MYDIGCMVNFISDRKNRAQVVMPDGRSGRTRTTRPKCIHRDFMNHPYVVPRTLKKTIRKDIWDIVTDLISIKVLVNLFGQ